VNAIIAILTLVTAVGAIWAALAATRQAQASSRQASIAEQSLGEQIRSFREQTELAREQNERARINLEANLMYKLWEQWTSRPYQDYRRRSLQYVKENFLVNNELLEVQQIDAATRHLFAFFDEIGYLTRTGVLRLERVMNTYGGSIRLGWPIWESAVKKMREEEGETPPDPSWYTNFEYLHHQGLDYDRKRGGTGAPPTKEELRHFIESALEIEEELHSAVWQKEPAAGDEEEPRKG
jgi:hypothetical protein